MALKYVKTEAGQKEIRERGHALPRGARTLLVLVDGTKDREQLLAMVQGAGPDDFAMLVELGLVAEHAGSSRGGTTATAASPPAEPAAAAPAPTAPADTAPVASASSAAPALGFKELYESMTQLVKSQLGLMKAFKYTLDIEKAGTVPELLDVARRFAAEVESSKGENAANMVRRALNITDER
jgi:hypothetical protein